MTHEEEVTKLLTTWKPRLLVSHWSVLVTFAEKDKAANIDSQTRLAEIVVHNRYTEARLTIFPAFFREPKGNRVTTLIHELCHIHTEPVCEVMDEAIKKGHITEKTKLDIWEALTERIAKIAVSAHSPKLVKHMQYHI